MSLGDDLKSQVKMIFGEQWSTRDARRIPDSEELKLSNDAVKLDGTVLYADLSGSTKLVNTYKDHFAAEIYKAYLHCAAKIIRSEGGVITAYDGDRIMAVYIGDYKNTSAARSGLKINYAVKNIVNPALKSQYPVRTYVVKQAVGIDTSKLYVTSNGNPRFKRSRVGRKGGQLCGEAHRSVERLPDPDHGCRLHHAPRNSKDVK